jgi:hypothetical protein
VRLYSNTLARQRITTVVPQRWHTRRGYVRGPGVDPDVVEDLA